MENTNKIVWKDIAGYEGIYHVSNAGEVRSKNRFVSVVSGGSRYCSGRMIKFKSNCDGYKIVSLSLQGKMKTHYIHRLVAIAFIQNLGNKPEVNHINGRKANNSVDNLEWVTHAENMAHAFRTGLCSNSGKNHHTARSVIDSRSGEEYDTIRQAAEATGYNYKSLKNMLSGSNPNTSTLEYKNTGEA